jgi:hypothetical protein
MPFMMMLSVNFSLFSLALTRKCAEKLYSSRHRGPASSESSQPAASTDDCQFAPQNSIIGHFMRRSGSNCEEEEGSRTTTARQSVNEEALELDHVLLCGSWAPLPLFFPPFSHQEQDEGEKKFAIALQAVFLFSQFAFRKKKFAAARHEAIVLPVT